jgi:hypothetical protein
MAATVSDYPKTASLLQHSVTNRQYERMPAKLFEFIKLSDCLALKQASSNLEASKCRYREVPYSLRYLVAFAFLRSGLLLQNLSRDI